MQLVIIQQKIYEVRNQKVMLDFDLAELYEIETRVLKQSVKRNIDRFPKDFMFQLSSKEWNELITNCDNLPQGVKFSPATPYAFTEHGVTMLASILRSKRAVQMNIAIVRAFIVLREMAMHYKELAIKIEELEKKYNKQFSDVYEALQILLQEKQQKDDFENRELIGFKPAKKKKFA